MDKCEEAENRWELSKENIQPLKQGRKASTLSVALEDSAFHKLNAIRHKFEEELRTYSGNDPLDVWYRYALWVEQNYPKGGKEGNLMKLIEKCVTAIHNNIETNEKYRNDSRILDLWIKYANLFPNPLEIYQTLEAKGLFTAVAEFYINWSWEMEKIGNFKRADAIYQTGLQLGAKPLNTLEEAHKKFQIRIARLTLEGGFADQESSISEPQRTALTSLKPQGPKSRVINERVGSCVLGPAGQIQQNQPTKNSNGPSFSIFQDSDAPASNSKIHQEDSSGGLLPVGASVNQENTKNPSRWSKVKIKNSSAGTVGVEDLHRCQKPTFSVYEDENVSQPLAVPATLPQISNVLSKHKENEDWHVPMFLVEPFDPKVQAQYCKHKVYCGTEEFSFEELRAAQYFRKEKEEQQRNDELKKMRDIMKKQEQMIQQLLQERDSQNKQEQVPQQNLSRSIYQDSWIAINKSVNASVNVSHLLDESTTSALLQCQPPTTTKSFKEMPDMQDLTSSAHAANRTSTDNSNLSTSNSSRGLNLTDPTVNTKLAINMINDMMSASLFKEDSQQDTGGSILGSETVSQPLAEENTPFTIFQDSEVLERNELYVDDQDKNQLPKDLIQEQRHQQNPGILQPSKDIQVMLVEDRQPQKDTEDKNEASVYGDIETKVDDDFNEDFSAIVPLDYVNSANFTMRVPNNPEAFAKMANMVSTPGPWSLGQVPQAKVTGDDFTMAVMIGNNHFPLIGKEVQETGKKDEEKEEVSGDLMPPPAVEPLPITPGPATKIGLSPIMEASREYRSSSSSSSGYSTSSTTFGGHSVHGFPQQGGIPTSSHTCRSRHYSNTQPESSLEIGASVQTEDFMKSGYLGDKSRGESLTDSRPCYAISQNVLKEGNKDDLTFDPQQAAALLMETDDLNPSLAASLRLDGRETNKLISKLGKPDPGQRINPFAEDVIESVLSRLEEPLEVRGGFVAVQSKLPKVKPNCQVALGSELFHVRRIRGEGAYAKAFQASTMDPMNVTIMPSEEENDEDDDEKQMILKMQKPACPWEFYICHELRQRLKKSDKSSSILDSVMRINRGYFFSNGSILVNQYHKYGTLLDVVNRYKAVGQTMPEEIVLYFMVEVLSILEALHSCSIIHADVKPDNFLIRDIPNFNKTSSNPAEIFSNCPVSLKIIDFGRSIDMKMFPEGTTFTEKVTTQGFTCCEMRDGQPWTYQTDLYGAAAIAYCCLFGSYMDVKKTIDGKWEIKGATFQRHWQRNLWHQLFSALLNVPSCSAVPSLSQLKEKIKMVFFQAEMHKEITVKFNSLLSIATQH
ncbi:mitotic checkpoint serine/threonine-protein kinase BUB1-like [Panulirus ornatus]|uniref:mitotic checkpoint serine/threonine-protein kinase BUB1-like n=1 Tax=Panulirus ornatus TaxID=150431 RepID=UPI003A840F62